MNIQWEKEGVPSVPPALLWSTLGFMVPNLDCQGIAVSVDVRSRRSVVNSLHWESLRAAAIVRARALVELLEKSDFAQYIDRTSDIVSIREAVVDVAARLDLNNQISFDANLFREQLLNAGGG